MRLIHSSASIAIQMRSKSSTTWRLGRLCGTSSTPVFVCSPMNAAKCCGIVRTSCVNRTRSSRAATASTSGVLQTGQTGFLRGLKIEGWFTALGCRQNNQVEVGISQKLSSHGTARVRF